MKKFFFEIFFSVVVLIAGLCTVWFSFEDPSLILRRNGLITPVAVVAAAFANATAVGGGFLFMPLFMFGFGLTAMPSLKLSLATQAFGMTSGMIGWSRQCLVIRAILLAAVGSGLGMYIGTYCWVLSSSLIKFVFGWASLLIGIVVLLEHYYGSEAKRRCIEEDTLLKAVMFLLLCFIGGLVTAWISIGVGEVVAVYLLVVYRLRIDSSIASGVAALAISSILGLLFHVGLGGIEWQYLVFTVPGVVLGGRYGAKCGRWIESTRRQRWDCSPVSWLSISPLKVLFVSIAIVDGVVMLWQIHFASGTP